MKMHVCKCGGEQFIELKRYTTSGAEWPRGHGLKGDYEHANPLTVKCDQCQMIWSYDLERQAWTNR